MSIHPSLSYSRNAHPGPRVSGRYRFSDIALSCTHSMWLADAVTSENKGSVLADVAGCANTLRVDMPDAASQSHSRLVKRMVLAPRFPVASPQPSKRGLHLIRVKIQFGQM